MAAKAQQIYNDFVAAQASKEVRFQSCSTIISLICFNKPLITNVTYHIA
jgi:hypothetical protein